MEYSTLSARLATFEPPPGAKRSKAATARGGWPHKRPTAQAVAQAGFYYSPQATAPGSDNVVCYLCDRHLDGWEADDDPVAEHVKHSPECGWAIMMAIAARDEADAGEMEDPTCAAMAAARRATFAAGRLWPHESKRGWTCKTERMVEAGWYFAPTDESDDWVTCVYCKLSLDGWEPKDNPFEEHYKRAPECPFFHFAGTTAPSKRPKAKKGGARSSKAAARMSRASTRVSSQSVVSVPAEEATMDNDVPDLDESIDTSTTSIMSTVSTMSTASAATTASKRKGRATGKSTRAKTAKVTRSTRAKKVDEQTLELEPAAAEPAEAELETAEPAEAEGETAEPAEAEIETTETALEQDNGERQAEEAEAEAKSPLPVAITYPLIPPAEVEEQQAVEDLARSPSPSPHAKNQDSPAAPSPAAHSPIQPQSAAAAAAVATPLTSDLASAGTPGSEAERPPWTPVDVDVVFRSDPADPVFQAAESFLMLDGSGGTPPLGEDERRMTVHEWIHHLARRAEQELRLESERVVGVFARQGARALQVLEDLECI